MTDTVTIAGRVLPRARLVARFEEKIDTTGECWEWTKSLNGSGYGCFGAWHGKSVLAHRVSWEIHRGPIPRGLYVLHHCDNRRCVRPNHLYLGTHEDNTRDAVERQRLRWTHRRTPNAKITPEIAANIRIRASNGEVQRVIAEEYGISQSNVSLIVQGRIWAEEMAA